jgi:peptidoglycan hydrolase CwlO-like protein
MLNSLLNDIKLLRDKKANKIGSLTKEKEQLEDKKKQIEEEYNKVTFHLKDIEDKILYLEKDFNQQFVALSKKAEHFQAKMSSH